MKRSSLIVSLFVPTFLFALGEGAIIPLIPIIAERLGADLSVAGIIATMIMAGQLVGDLPAGWLVSRLGERWSMIGAATFTIAALTVCAVAPSWPYLLFGIFLVGLTTSVFSLARQTFVTVHVPEPVRARALSTLAGVFRAGLFLGPFLSAAVVSATSSPQSAFVVHVICCMAAIAVLAVVHDPTADRAELHSVGSAPTTAEPQTLRALLRTHGGVLLRMGAGAAIISGVRSARQVLLPLWALAIGLDDTTTALVIGVANGIDFALFYVSGHLMDKYGRMWVVVPMLGGVGTGFLILAATALAPAPFAWFTGAAIFISIASGMGAGIVMTIAADLAPRPDPAVFLAVFRLIGDAGNAVVPLGAAAVIAGTSITFATIAIGVVGLCGSALMRLWMPRYLAR